MSFSDDLITVCPVCGFSFRTFDLKIHKKIKKCPMCGYIINEPDVFPHHQQDVKDPYY